MLRSCIAIRINNFKQSTEHILFPSIPYNLIVSGANFVIFVHVCTPENVK